MIVVMKMSASESEIDGITARIRKLRLTPRLSYVIASALALMAQDAGPFARKLAGKGFADATQLAGFAYEIQGEAARANARLPRSLREFERNLERLLRALGPSVDGRKEFRRARRAREH